MKTLFLLISASLLVPHAQAQTPAPAKSEEPSATPAKRTHIKYAPPKNAVDGTRVDGDGGSRGGDVKFPALYVLTPNHTGITTRAQPSLFWYQSGPASTRFELTVVEPKSPKPLLRVGSDKADQPGIHRLLLARHNVSLTPGVLYKWTVALVPDPENRSKDVIASGTIQRVEPDAKLTAALADAKGFDKAAIYANQGVWYDAVEAITDEIDASPKNTDLHIQRATLLEQAGLKDAAAAERK